MNNSRPPASLAGCTGPPIFWAPFLCSKSVAPKNRHLHIMTFHFHESDWKLRMRNLIFVGAMALSLAACNDSTTQFIGHWEQIGKNCSTMDIEKNGDAMLIKVKAPGMFGREAAAFPGVMNGETLNVTIRGTVQAMLI